MEGKRLSSSGLIPITARSTRICIASVISRKFNAVSNASMFFPVDKITVASKFSRSTRSTASSPSCTIARAKLRFLNRFANSSQSSVQTKRIFLRGVTRLISRTKAFSRRTSAALNREALLLYLLVRSNRCASRGTKDRWCVSFVETKSRRGRESNLSREINCL
jgi:hypothetical protein